MVQNWGAYTDKPKTQQIHFKGFCKNSDVFCGFGFALQRVKIHI